MNASSLKDTLLPFIQLTRIDRPVGIYLVLWPALWALWLAADDIPSLYHLFAFTLGAVLMRSAGCVINDYADRNFDGQVARTCHRPLATGVVSARAALVFFVLLAVTAFLLVLTLNELTVWLSFGALGLASLYPFTKRHTYWPQAFLGAAFAWAIPMAFAAEQSVVPKESWLVFAIVMLWALIYDTAYALADKECDEKAGIKSTARLFGSQVNNIIALFQAIMWLGLLWLGYLFSLGLGYDLSLFGVLLLFFYHQKLLRIGTKEAAFKAFLSNHWIGLLLLLGTVFDKLVPLHLIH